MNGVRLRLADASLALMMVALPLATIWMSSRALFRVATLLNLLLVVVMLPAVRIRLAAWSATSIGRGAALLVLALFAVWQQIQGPMWDVPRLWWYLSLPLLMAALLGWFELRGEAGLRLLLRAKLPVIAFAVVWVCGVSLLSRFGLDEPVRLDRLPIFRHVRHLNVEMPWAMALAALLVATAGRTERGLALLLLVLFGYFSAWSGGRGQWLAMVVSLAVLALSRALPVGNRRLWQAVGAVAIGLSIAVLLGEGERLLAMFGRSVGDAGIGMSSGRDRIWAASLQAVTASGWTVVTGLGPDAFARLALDRDFRQFTGALVQPHNTLVLWLLEFGLAGLLALVAAAGLALRLARRRLQARPALDAVNVVAALVIGYAAFSMVDGIAYHAMPATFLLVLMAFLAHRRPLPADPIPSSPA